MAPLAMAAMGIDEGGGHLGDLTQAFDEEHHRVVDGDNGLDEGAGRVEHADQPGHGGHHDVVADEGHDLLHDHFAQVGKAFADAFPGRGRAVADQRNDDIEAGFHGVDRRFADGADQLAADVLPGQAKHAEYKLDDFLQRQRLRNVDIGAAHCPGQPADQRRPQVGQDVAGELAEALNGSANQIADKVDRVGDDGPEGPGRPAGVRHDGWRHDIEDDFEQAHHLRTGPADEAPGKIAENADDAPESLDRCQQVVDAEAAQGVHEQAGQGGDEAHQADQRAMEPGHRPRHGTAFLQIAPDLFLADQAHEAADQRFGRARHRLAGDRVAAEHGTEQIPAAHALRQPASGRSTASRMNWRMPDTRLPTKLVIRAIGSVTMRLARSQTPPRSKMSVQLSESRKRSTACRMLPATSPRLFICCCTQPATRSMMP